MDLFVTLHATFNNLTDWDESRVCIWNYFDHTTKNELIIIKAICRIEVANH